jgi:hypothetical protein
MFFIIILQHVSAAYAGHHQIETHKVIKKPKPQPTIFYYGFVSFYITEGAFK